MSIQDNVTQGDDTAPPPSSMRLTQLGAEGFPAVLGSVPVPVPVKDGGGLFPKFPTSPAAAEDEEEEVPLPGLSLNSGSSLHSSNPRSPSPRTPSFLHCNRIVEETESVTVHLFNGTAVRFQIIKKLGTGNHGCVFLVTEDSGRSTSVLKVVPPPSSNSLTKTHFEAEGTIMHGLSIPGIPFCRRIFNCDFGKIALEFDPIDGDVETLEQYVNKPNRNTAIIARQLLEIVMHLHSQWVVHRDIKPSNVLIRLTDSTVFLIDFGCAWKFHEATQRWKRVSDHCTEAYTNPHTNQLNQGTWATQAWNDVYAMCLTIEVVRTGSIPPLLRRTSGFFDDREPIEPKSKRYLGHGTNADGYPFSAGLFDPACNSAEMLHNRLVSHYTGTHHQGA